MNNPPAIARCFSWITLAVVGLATLAATGGCAPKPPTVTPTIPVAPGTVSLIAKNISFSVSRMTVPSGTDVTVNFDNQDAGIAHNFAVYRNLEGGQTEPVFVGDTIIGPAKMTYSFKAPGSSGSYFFECDVHPSTMNGEFAVK